MSNQDPRQDCGIGGYRNLESDNILLLTGITRYEHQHKTDRLEENKMFQRV